MPRQKDLKRLVRARMQKTGEAYTTARAHILEKPISGDDAAAAAPPAATAPGLAALAGKSDDAVKAKTGRDWAGWVAVLDELGGDRLPHREIARIVNERYDVDGWWAQTVTVGYERIKGLREHGQRRDGFYEANKSRTVNVPVDVLFDAWAEEATRRGWLPGTEPVVRTATRPRTIRLGWEDGTIVVVGFMEKGAGKSAVAVQHTRLPDRAAADRMKAFWGERLDALAKLLDEST